MLSEIQTSLGRALKLIEFSKTLIGIESGKIALNPVEFEIQKNLNGFLPTFELGMKKKGLTFALDFDEQPAFILAEPTIFCHTIIGNIVSNAIKFSLQQETITISVHGLVDKVVVAIKNCGPGI